MSAGRAPFSAFDGFSLNEGRFSLKMASFIRKRSESTSSSVFCLRPSIAVSSPTIPRFVILRSTSGSSARFSSTWKQT